MKGIYLKIMKKYKILIGLALISIILALISIILASFLMILTDDYTMYNLSIGEDKFVRMCYNDSYIYATLYTTPGKIVKIDTTNPSYPTIYTLSAGDNQPFDICTGGGYLYFGLYAGTIHKVIKMDPSDGTYVTYSLGTTNPARICYVNDYLWIMHDQIATVITKMDPSDGSYIEFNISGHHDACSAEFDGEWIWIVGNNPPDGLLAKFNVNNNSYVVKNLIFNPSAAYWDGTYLWISSWESPGRLVRYNTTDNTYITFSVFDSGYDNIREIKGDGNYRVLCTFDTENPGRVALVYTNNGKIDYTKFSKTNYLRSICFDNGYAWVGSFTSPASYAKLK